MVQRQGETEPFIRTVFTLQSCTSIVGSQILCFTQEKQLLQVDTCIPEKWNILEQFFNSGCFLFDQSWAEFLRTVDPDIITGYNIQNFDFPYLINRAAALKVWWSHFYLVKFKSQKVSCGLSSFVEFPAFPTPQSSIFSSVQVTYFPYLGRVRNMKSVLKESNFQSKQMGRRENKTINMEGRVQFDLLQVSS